MINAYNDGSPAPREPPLGPFYELETSSPGAELAPGASLTHKQVTVHFVGQPEQLDPIAGAKLGAGIRKFAMLSPAISKHGDLSDRAMTDSKPIAASRAVLPRGAVWPFVLLASCFLWWGVANKITDPVVKVFKEIFGMSTFQASLIQG